MPCEAVAENSHILGGIPVPSRAILKLCKLHALKKKRDMKRKYTFIDIDDISSQYRIPCRHAELLYNSCSSDGSLRAIDDQRSCDKK